MKNDIKDAESSVVRTGYFFALFLIVFFAFWGKDAKSAPKNSIKILFLGNSITKHGPAPELGWYGDWGMAASSEEKDFVHVLINLIKINYKNADIDFKEQNIASWERDFKYNLSASDMIKGYYPDILIVRLGENVSESYAQSNDYYTALSNLINYYKSKETKVLVTGNYWTSSYKDSIQQKIADNNGYSFVDISELKKDSKNSAFGLFKHKGVAEHPSDQGMQAIATLIYDRIKLNEWIK